MSPTERHSDRDRLLAQQAAIARFGDRALRTEDLQALLQEAIALAAAGLGITRAKVLELMPGGRRLLVRAGIGWNPGVVGKETIGADIESPAGFALQTGQPVISENLDTEHRFRVPELLRRHGIKSAINVIIKGAGPPFGVLEVDSAEPRSFTEDDTHFLQGYANLLAAAIERLHSSQVQKVAAEELKAATEEKTLLLRELQHRVKNNFQTIVSVIRLQRAVTDNLETRASLDDIAHRLQAMALVHQQLYALGHTSAFDLSDYLGELCRNLVRTAEAGTNGIKLDLRLESMIVSVDVGLPLGLIANEFIANSLKYAFPEGRGMIRVALKRVHPGKAEFELADDGVGQPPSTETKKDSGLGLRLIQGLANQIGGTLEWNRERGTRAMVTFPLRVPAESRS